MLGYCIRLGKDHIARLHLPLHVLLGIRFHAQIRLCRPQGCLILIAQRGRTIGIRYLILLPTAESLRIVVEMTVFIVEDISAVETEIEVAIREIMREIQSYFGLTECSQTPLGMMVCIHIQDGLLAVVQMVSEIEQGVRMTNRSAYIPVVRATRLKARRL